MSRKYRPPYARKPAPGLVAADVLYAEAQRRDRTWPSYATECPNCGNEVTRGWCDECSTDLVNA